MKKFGLLIFLLLQIAGYCPELWAEEPEKEVTEEHLIFMEVPVVVTASMKEQPITEAPAAVTVITAEEIKQSGALTVPDVLRMVSGIDVISISAKDQQVGMRGMNAPINNKVLVMVDSRSIYTDFVGDVYWQALPVSMEEIERIEVIKSPISSLYGANAFSGVINIITKSSEELKDLAVNASAGNKNTYIGSLFHAGEAGKLHYKFSAGFDSTDVWDPGDKDMKVFRGNLHFDYNLGPEHTVSLSGGRTHFEALRLFVNETAGTLQQNGNFDYLQADYKQGGFTARAYWKSEKTEGQNITRETPDEWNMSSYNIETGYSFDAGKGHYVVTGVEYRYYKLAGNPVIPAGHSQNLWAFFVEDEFRIMEKLRLTAGARYDHHPLANSHLSPRATLIYALSKGDNVRLSVSRAFRNPSFLDSYLFIEEQHTLTLPPPFPPDVPFKIVSSGNTALKAEGITSYELGYRSTFAEKAVLGLNLFYNEYSDLFITSTETAFYGADELFPGSPGGTIPKQITERTQNGGGVWGVGGEIDINANLSDWLSAFANYSYERITDKKDNPFTLIVNEKGKVRPQDPRHKINAGLMMKFKNGLSATLLAHWVDKTERLILDLNGNEHIAKVDAYTILNGRIGYTFMKGKAEASIYAFNLFNDMHFEYPPGINLPDRSSDEIGRKIVLRMSYRFQ